MTLAEWKNDFKGFVKSLSISRDDYKEIMEYIDDVPEAHWIPVTEDTPKEADTYMCTCSDAGRRIVTLVKWQPRTKTWNLTGARAYWKVIAWMPLPESYKGVTDGRD